MRISNLICHALLRDALESRVSSEERRSGGEIPGSVVFLEHRPS